MNKKFFRVQNHIINIDQITHISAENGYSIRIELTSRHNISVTFNSSEEKDKYWSALEAILGVE